LREKQRLQVFEKNLGSRKDEVTEEWRRQHKEQLHDLYYSPNIIRVVKSRRMRWARNVARLGDCKVTYSVSVG
jgi:predicted DNA-binding protein